MPKPQRTDEVTRHQHPKVGAITIAPTTDALVFRDPDTQELREEDREIRPWPELQEAIRPLSESERDRLRTSLRKHGQVHAILIWPDDRDENAALIVDGYHRWMLGPDPKVDILSRLNREEAFALGITLNADRRQMTPGQIRKVDEYAAKAIQALRAGGKTQAEVAETLGISQQSVSKVEATALPGNTTGSNAGQTDQRRTVTPEQVKAVQTGLGEGKTQRQVAEETGVPKSTVATIAKPKAKPRKRKPKPRAKPKPGSITISVQTTVTAMAKDLYEQALAALGREKDVEKFAQAFLAYVDKQREKGE